jgi:hypothetical protein
MNTTKKTINLFFLMIVLTLGACSPPVTTPRVPSSTPTPAPSANTPGPIVLSPTQVEQSAIWKPYTNSTYGLRFRYPSNWFGPEDYAADHTLRVEVGSDRVYPYGQPPEQPSDVRNSYNVVIQLTKNNPNPFWKDTYQSLSTLKDGESLLGARGLIIRVRQVDLGRFKGFEYISTLSEKAQTEPVYSRDVMLFDEQTNDLLTIMGQPINVEVSNGANWRDDYRRIDEANLNFFHEIVESMTVDDATFAIDPPATCPLTRPPEAPFTPPSPYPETPPGNYIGRFWYGTPELWTMLSADGTWRGLPQSGGGYSQKVFWWRQGYDMNAEPNPRLTVTGKRLDTQSAPLLASSATNASADFGEAMLVGVNIPTPGCWEITGEYNGQSLSFVVWITP